MDYDAFVRSLSDTAPPADAEVALRALWHDANGNSVSALRAAGFDSGHAGLRVRAYLQRKAGELHEARLWYWRAGLEPWTGSAESEWEDIARTVLTERVVANAYT